MSAFCSLFVAVAMLLLPGTTSAVTIQTATPTPMAERATFAYVLRTLFRS